MSKPKFVKLRAAPAFLNLADARIDRENLVIRDTVAMLANVEALGHGFQSDQRTLEIMLMLANGDRFVNRGVKMHFGHIGMSENAMGRQIARARNFRIQGDKLVHDIHFIEQAAISPVFSQDPVEYIFQIAETQPQEIGESVVIETDVVWTLPDGTEVDGFAERPENALTDLPVMRPVTLYYVDVVADPALTRDGLLTSAMFAGSSSFYSNEAFQLIDEFRSEYNISLEDLPRKVEQVLGRYMQARGFKPGAVMTKTVKRKFDESDVEVGTVADVLGSEPTETPAADAAPAPEAEPAQEAAPASEVDDALETAKATEAALAPADEPETEEPAVVPASEYAAAMKRIDELAAQVEKLTELATVNARTNAILAAKVQALESEPVVTDTIGGPRHLSTPRMPDVKTLRTPTHVKTKVQRQSAAVQSQSGAPAANPALASLAASQARTGIE